MYHNLIIYISRSTECKQWKIENRDTHGHSVAVGLRGCHVLLNDTSMFNHGNIRLPLNVARLLRLMLVTPDMHRVHHSVVIKETNSNFGFNFPWWDRFLGTYRNKPAAGHDNMTIGLSQFCDEKKLTLPWLLAFPFIGILECNR